MFSKENSNSAYLFLSSKKWLNFIGFTAPFFLMKEIFLDIKKIYDSIAIIFLYRPCPSGHETGFYSLKMYLPVFRHGLDGPNSLLGGGP